MASSYRRGGLKKEALVNGGTAQDAGPLVQLTPEDYAALEEELKGVLELLNTPKAGKDWSAAIWRPELGAAELVLARRGTGQQMGFSLNRRHYLHIEEAAYLVDRADLMLFVEVPDNQQQQGHQPPPQGPTQRRLLSLQETFELMELCGVDMERYIVYTSLSRLGYLLMRYPSRWVLEEGQRPWDVWGHGAWARCHGMQPLQPGQQVHRADVGHCLRSLHQGVVPSLSDQPAPLPTGFTPPVQPQTQAQKQAQPQAQGQPQSQVQVQVQKQKQAQPSQELGSGNKVDRATAHQPLQQQQLLQQVPPAATPLQGLESEQAGGSGGGSTRPSKRLRQEAAHTHEFTSPPPSAAPMQDVDRVDCTRPHAAVIELRPPGDPPKEDADGEVERQGDPQEQQAALQEETLQQLQPPPPLQDYSRLALVATRRRGQALVPHMSGGLPSRAWWPLREGALDLGKDGLQGGGAPGVQPSSTEGPHEAASRVQPSAGAQIRAAFPLLHPLPPILPRGSGSLASNQSGGTGRAQAVQPAAGAAAVGNHRGTAHASGIAAGHPGHLAGPQAQPALLTRASHSGHLVFDVYQPGCKVARSRRSFPTLHCHLALSSAGPPGLAELSLAASQALGPHVPVRWVAVEGGIMTMYELGPADLLQIL